MDGILHQKLGILIGSHKRVPVNKIFQPDKSDPSPLFLFHTTRIVQVYIGYIPRSSRPKLKYLTI